MKTNFKFDHAEDDLSKAIGYQGNMEEDLQKLTETLVDEFEDGQGISTSLIIEKVQTIFTDEAILVLAGMAVKEAVVGRQEAMEQMATMMAKIGISEENFKAEDIDFESIDASKKNSEE